MDITVMVIYVASLNLAETHCFNSLKLWTCPISPRIVYACIYVQYSTYCTIWYYFSTGRQSR